MTSPAPDTGQQNSAIAEPSMLAGLLTLRGVWISSRQASHDSPTDFMARRVTPSLEYLHSLFQRCRPIYSSLHTRLLYSIHP